MTRTIVVVADPSTSTISLAGRDPSGSGSASQDMINGTRPLRNPSEDRNRAKKVAALSYTPRLPCGMSVRRTSGDYEAARRVGAGIGAEGDPDIGVAAPSLPAPPVGRCSMMAGGPD